jgi:NhaP-type Na+/H+ or K+/H+ antiporter
MRGSSISFLTRARSAWLDSCLGWLLCILVRCHVSKGITGQLGTALTVLELFFLARSFDVSGRLPVIAGLALDGHPRRAGLGCRCYHFTFSSPEDSNG